MHFIKTSLEQVQTCTCSSKRRQGYNRFWLSIDKCVCY